MIGWLVDRVWVWRHRAELRALDEEAAVIAAQRARIDRDMEEMGMGPEAQAKWWHERGRELLERGLKP